MGKSSEQEQARQTAPGGNRLRRLLIVFFMGVCSGLPLALTAGTLQAWMTKEGVDIRLVGLFNAISFPYSFKFFWAPLFDHTSVGTLGRRRGWLLATQLLLGVLIVALGLSDPRSSLVIVGALAVLVALLSASQDIVIDAYRREILSSAELGMGASLANIGYRAGMLISGAMALGLADHFSWATVYQIMGGAMFLGVGITLLAPEPEALVKPRAISWSGIVEPFSEFFSRRHALEVLAFVFLYKIGDILALALSTPFFLSLGFSLTEIAAVLKGVGLAATILGGLAGGALMMRLDLRRALLYFGVAQTATLLVYAMLAASGRDLSLMITAVCVDNFCAGLGTAAFVALLMRLCDRRFTGTQYALLTSIMAVPRSVIGASSGYLVGAMGWTNYFFLSIACALPALLLIVGRFRAWEVSETIKQ